ncbi:MAG: hypothetical protein DHS20C01_34550 [marine bacterium B5-7]|nr:MAG: hypothetical protein DHS20C01_34550 [marine bacterium B5-7]
MKSLLAFVLWLSSVSYAADVPRAVDLQADGVGALAASQPVIVFYSATYCEYCDAVRAEFFQHLLSDPRYASRIILREVVIDSDYNLTDFSGKRASHRSFAGLNGVQLVPTVRFVDGHGNNLADPMIGVTTMDYYGWYLNKRINRSINQLIGSGEAVNQSSDQS